MQWFSRVFGCCDFVVLKLFDSSCITDKFFVFSEYSDVAAYRLSLSEDTKALNQLVCQFCLFLFPYIDKYFCLSYMESLSHLQNFDK